MSQRKSRGILVLAAVVWALSPGFARAHGIHLGLGLEVEAGGNGEPGGSEDKRTGEGEWTFRWNRELSELPEEAKKVLAGAHGGFAVDWKGNRDVYFALKGCGVIKMSADLTKKEVIHLDPYLLQGNFHNTTLIRDEKGNPYLALPDDERERVYIASVDGKLINVLQHPRGNQYYDSWQAFKPTDVEQAPDRTIFIVTGYSPGDYVVTADPFSGQWKKLIFGGKGAQHGQFNTGHGITWNPVKETLDIADRPNSRIESYGTDGTYKSTVGLPPGSLPCDVSFMDGFTLVGCLEGPDKKQAAPVYIVNRDGSIVSTVKPKDDLGLGLFTHVHNAAWHAVGSGDGKKTYLLVQAWNPGGFAVLELERKGKTADAAPAGVGATQLAGSAK